MKELHTLGRRNMAAEDQCAKQAQEEDVATNTTLVRYAIHLSLLLYHNNRFLQIMQRLCCIHPASMNLYNKKFHIIIY